MLIIMDKSFIRLFYFHSTIRTEGRIFSVCAATRAFLLRDRATAIGAENSPRSDYRMAVRANISLIWSKPCSTCNTAGRI